MLKICIHINMIYTLYIYTHYNYIYTLYINIMLVNCIPCLHFIEMFKGGIWWFPSFFFLSHVWGVQFSPQEIKHGNLFSPRSKVKLAELLVFRKKQKSRQKSTIFRGKMMNTFHSFKFWWPDSHFSKPPRHRCQRGRGTVATGVATGARRAPGVPGLGWPGP